MFSTFFEECSIAHGRRGRVSKGDGVKNLQYGKAPGRKETSLFFSAGRVEREKVEKKFRNTVEHNINIFQITSTKLHHPGGKPKIIGYQLIMHNIIE